MIRTTERGQLVKPLAVSLVAGTLMATTFTWLQLWGSVGAARAFAAREEFISLFSLAAFAESTVLATQLALPRGLLRIRKILADENLAILLITMLGFEGMLLVGQLVPWVPYWAPMAPLASALACILLFGEQQLPGRLPFLVLGLMIAANLLYVAAKLT